MNKQLVVELNIAQKRIYSISNIKRTFKDFDDRDIAYISLKDDKCIVTRTDGSYQSYPKADIQVTYYGHCGRLVDYFHNLGPNYLTPMLWRNSVEKEAYVMFKGVSYETQNSQFSPIVKRQRELIDHVNFSPALNYVDVDNLSAVLEDPECNTGHLVMPNRNDEYGCSCGSYQKQLIYQDEFKQELCGEHGILDDVQSYEPQCIHRAWYYRFREYRNAVSQLRNSLPTGFPTKCAAWWYAPPEVKGTKGYLLILYTDKGYLAKQKDWKTYRPELTLNQYDLWEYLFRMLLNEYVPYCGHTTIPQITFKNEKNNLTFT